MDRSGGSPPRTEINQSAFIHIQAFSARSSLSRRPRPRFGSSSFPHDARVNPIATRPTGASQALADQAPDPVDLWVDLGPWRSTRVNRQPPSRAIGPDIAVGQGAISGVRTS